MLRQNPFEADWDTQYAWAKIQAYLLYYVVFFVALLAALFAVGSSGVLRKSADKLLLGAYRSELYLYDKFHGPAAAGGPAAYKCPSLSAFLRGNREICEDAGGLADTDSLLKVNGNVGDKVVNALWRAKDPRYRLLLEYVLMQRCVLGCGDVLFEGGLRVLGVHFSPGLVEDFLLYVSCNHSVVSCCFAARGLRYSRTFKKYSLIVQHSVSFFVSNMLIVVLTTAGVGSEYSQATTDPGDNIVVNMLVDMVLCTPISLFLSAMLYRVYTIKVVEGESSELKNKIVSRFLAMLMVAVSLSSLVLLSLLTTGRDKTGALNNVYQYLWSVLLASIVYDLIFTVLLYQNKYYYSVSFCYGVFNPIKVGQYYLESLAILRKEEGKDFVDSSYVWLDGLVAVDSLHPPAKEEAGEEEATADDGGIELNIFGMYPAAAAASSTADSSSGAVAVMAAINRRSSLEFQTVNPMHSSGGAGASTSRSSTSRASEATAVSGVVGASSTAEVARTSDLADLASGYAGYSKEEEEEEEASGGSSYLDKKERALRKSNKRRSFVSKLIYWEAVGFAGGGRANPLSKSEAGRAGRRSDAGTCSDNAQNDTNGSGVDNNEDVEEDDSEKETV